MAPECAHNFIPDACLVESESFVYNKIENEAHAHSHEMAEGARRAEFFACKGDRHFFRAQNLHQQQHGIVASVNGNTA